MSEMGEGEGGGDGSGRQRARGREVTVKKQLSTQCDT